MTPHTEEESKYTSKSRYEKTRLPVEEATTLPPDSYYSEQFHKVESQSVFGHAWTCVGYTCQVDEPGKMLTAQISGQPIVVTRDKQGVLRGFYNVCRHRASILVTEDTILERFRCPYHSWTYDLTGKLLNCPLFAMSGSCKSYGGEDGSGAAMFNKEDYSLLPIKVSTWGCFIFANLSTNAEPLSDYLGDLPQIYKNFPLHELVLVRRKKYEIQSNWKLIAENFLEYYHLPWVHPELCEVSAINMHKRNQGSGMYMSFYAHPLLKGGSAIDVDQLPPMPNLNTEEKNSGYFPYIFPNLALFLFPHHLFVLLMNSDASTHTSESGDLLVHPSVLHEPQAQTKIDAMFEFYDMVNKQDILAVERVQQGIQVRAYPGGRMSYRFEEPVHRFQNMVIDYMTGEKRIYLADDIYS